MKKMGKDTQLRTWLRLLLRPQGASAHELSEHLGLREADVVNRVGSIRKQLESKGWGFAVFQCPFDRTNRRDIASIAANKRVYKVDAVMNLFGYVHLFDADLSLKPFCKTKSHPTRLALDYDFVTGHTQRHDPCHIVTPSNPMSGL